MHDRGYNSALTRWILAAALIMGVFPAAACMRSTDESAASHADTPAVSQSYFAANSIAVDALPAPPFPGDKAWGEDIRSQLCQQGRARDGDFALARAEQRLRPEVMTNVMGPGFIRDAFPATYRLLDRAYATTAVVTKVAKDYWRVPRPYTVDKRVLLMITPLPPNNFAYPSGHTAAAYVWAGVLQTLVPDAAQALRRHAAGVAQRRIVAGVHSPHDIAAGSTLASLILARLDATPAYQLDQRQAHDELVKANYRWPNIQSVPFPYDDRVRAPVPSGVKNWKSFPSRVTE